MLAANTRAICGALWQCHTQSYRDTYHYSHTYNYANTDSHSHSNCNGYTYRHCQA